MKIPLGSRITVPLHTTGSEEEGKKMREKEISEKEEVEDEEKNEKKETEGVERKEIGERWTKSELTR